MIWGDPHDLGNLHTLSGWFTDFCVGFTTVKILWFAKELFHLLFCASSFFGATFQQPGGSDGWFQQPNGGWASLRVANEVVLFSMGWSENGGHEILGRW